MIRNKKQYFIYYLNNNILILDVFEYLESLAADTVDYFTEWHLIQNNKIKFKKNIILNFIENKIDSDIQSFIQIANKIDCSILCFYKPNSNIKDWELFYEDPKRFINLCKRTLKKKLPNFIENKNEDVRLFENVKGTFLDVPCLIPSGEDEFFLQKFFKKLNKTYLTIQPIDDKIECRL